MALVCPQCNGTFDQQMECPRCGVRLGFDPEERVRGTLVTETPSWQQKPLGRILVGILLAQGLAHGLGLAFDAGFLTGSQQATDSIWSTVFGFVLLQSAQAVGLLVAGALAGAGQHRGFILGALVGLLNSILLLSLQTLNNYPMSELVLYGQPALHVFCGAVGGLIGSLIWKPPPTIELALPVAPKKGKKRDVPSQFAGPIAWPRVAAGTIIAAGGAVSARLVLDFIITHSQGELKLSSALQSEMVTWEIAALIVILGAIFSGMNCFNGLKQGLCVGVVATILVVAYRLSNPRTTLDDVIFTVFFIGGLSLFGGWFGSKLFPPVISRPKQRIPSYS